jgi:hypothetical protein
MAVAFWSITLTPGKTVDVQPPEGYVLNISQAAATGYSDSPVVLKVLFQFC